MITEAGPRWLVTIAFAGVALFCLYRCLRGGPVGGRVGDVLHVLMCAGMIAMAWPAATNFAHVPQLLLFALAAVWFVGMTVFGVSCHEAHNRFALGHHALMMGGMAWMLLVMPTAMAGMTMSTPKQVAIVGVVLAVVFLVAGVGRLAHAVDTGRARPARWMPTAGQAADGVMSLGMALMAALLV